MWSSERFLWPLCSSSCSVLLQFRLSLKGFVSPTLCGVAAESQASWRHEISSLFSPKGELTTSLPVLCKGLRWDNSTSLQKRQALAAGGTTVPVASEPVASRKGAVEQGALSHTGASVLLEQQPLSRPSPPILARTKALPPRKPSVSGSALSASRKGTYLSCKPCRRTTGGGTCPLHSVTVRCWMGFAILPRC